MDPDPPLTKTDVVMESVLSSVIPKSASFNPYESNVSTEELDSAVKSINLEGERIDSPAPGGNSPSLLSSKADYTSLSPSDVAVLDSPMTATIAPFKIEENPFSPEVYTNEDMYPALPSPQGPVPSPTASSAPPDHILVDGVYYQRVPAPHNVVVAQSAVPTPTLAPVVSSNTSSMSTTNESDYESIVVVTSSDVHEPQEGKSSSKPTMAAGNPPAPSAVPSTSNPEPRVGLEFAMSKTPPPASKPKNMPKEGRRS